MNKIIYLVIFILLTSGCTIVPSPDSYGPAPVDPKEQMASWLDDIAKGRVVEGSIWCDVPGKAYMSDIFSSTPRFKGYACLFDYRLKGTFGIVERKIFMAFFTNGKLTEVSSLARLGFNLHFIDGRSGYRSPESLKDSNLAPAK